MPKQQKSRAHKESQGKHGGGGKGRPLTGIEKILMGGGLYRNINKPNFGKKITEPAS
jgi:hypothetical protein